MTITNLIPVLVTYLNDQVEQVIKKIWLLYTFNNVECGRHLLSLIGAARKH
jgi:hypothetical protein